MQMSCCIFYKRPDELVLFITVQTRGLTYKVLGNPLRHEVSDELTLLSGQQSNSVFLHRWKIGLYLYPCLLLALVTQRLRKMNITLFLLCTYAQMAVLL